MTNTTSNTREVVEDLIKDIKKTCSGANEIGYIKEECNFLFTFYTNMQEVYTEEYREMGNHYIDVYGNIEEDEENEFDYLILKVEISEVGNGRYEIYDIYETSKY